MSVVRPLTADDTAIGGKARSLARLRALGLPVPVGFAIASSLARALGDAGPRPPAVLRTAADLAALEAAHAAMATAPLSGALMFELDAALDRLDPSPDSGARFSVRSSGEEEDSAAGAAPGIFESVVPVARAGVARAVTRVLASAFSPAAWTTRGPSESGGRARVGLAVLVHRHVEGTAQGAASASSPVDDGAPGDAPSFIRVDAQAGVPTAGARARIEAALAAAVARFGPSEIEWTANGDEVTFLQLRPYRAGGAPRSRPAGAGAADAGHPTLDDDHRGTDGWTWDAAHNPEPLSPAQAGLVALVDATADTGLRQRVIDGYLCFQRVRAAGPPGSPPRSPRRLFDRLANDVAGRLEALGPWPTLAQALDTYVTAYERLFGVVQAACASARAALTSFLEEHLPDATEAAQPLVEGVSSAATDRSALAAALVAATAPDARQAAADAYLTMFGDESPRWDIACPTLSETPERLLRAAAVPRPAAATNGPRSDPHRARDEAGRLARTIAERLPAAARPGFENALQAAREAAAVAEDDDALFARLQALVRRALLALGRRLAAAGALAAADDVFFLPLDLARALDRGAPPGPHDLNGLAAAARQAWAAAAAAPPWSRAPAAATASPALVHGSRGAPGRAIGRVAHHPAAVPSGLDAATVLVAATLLPTELPLLDPAAIVVETGTVLGHVAAQARERGIPALVGAAGARAALPPGTLVVVDGDRGLVIRLDQGGS